MDTIGEYRIIDGVIALVVQIWFTRPFNILQNTPIESTICRLVQH